MPPVSGATLPITTEAPPDAGAFLSVQAEAAARAIATNNSCMRFIAASCFRDEGWAATGYFSVMTYFASVFASSSLTAAFGGIGIGPHTPVEPSLIFFAR